MAGAAATPAGPGSTKAGERSQPAAAEKQRSSGRKNAATACDACRRKRVRCIRTDESSGCDSCRSNNTECVFSGLDRRRDAHELRGRLSQLEDLLEKLKGSNDMNSLKELINQAAEDGGRDSRSSTVDTGDRSARNGCEEAAESARKKRKTTAESGVTESTLDYQIQSPRPQLQTTRSFGSTGQPHRPRDEVPLDISGVVDSLAIEDGGIRAYGPTSNHSLAVEAPEHSSQQYEQNAGATPSHYAPPASTPAQLPENSLLIAAAHNVSSIPLGTDIRTVEALLNLYFIWHHAVFPVLSRELFIRHFCNGGRYYSPLLLNAVLALASHLSDWPLVRSDAQNSSTTGASFFEKAKALLDDELERPTVTTVQALCLMAKHEAYNGRALKGGLYIAMCGRLVLDLGLHLDATPLVKRGLLDVEDCWVRARTFWGIWSVDKEFSALVGRPSAIRDVIITCPKPGYWQAEDLDWWASYNTGRLVSLTGDKAKGVFDIGELATDMAGVHLRAMDQMYWRESKALLEENLQALEYHMSATKEAMASLPPLSSNSADRVIPHIYTMHMVYHCHTIILNRPFLFASGVEKGSGGPDDAKISLPRSRCFESAREIIRLMTLVRNATANGLRTTLNCHQHNLVTAAAIFILELTPRESTHGSTTRMHLAREALTETLKLLEEMSSFRPAAFQALANLRDLLSKRQSQVNVTFDEQSIGKNHLADANWIPNPHQGNGTSDGHDLNHNYSFASQTILADNGISSFVDALDSGIHLGQNGIPDSHALPDFDVFFAQQQSYLYPTLGCSDPLDSTLFFQAQMIQSRPQTPSGSRG